MDSEFFERVSKMSPQRLALLAARLKEQVDALREPLAIVGMGCRLPGGVVDPDGFWQLLDAGRDAIREVPADRWDIDAYFDPDPDAPGRMSVRSGGFLDEVAGFDAAFFGIAAREAQTLDPQQRLLLEVTWEALEHGGLAPAQLAGASAGVFVGICNSDHFQRTLSRGADRIDAYVASGNAHSTAAGRISYCLGLRGPAIAIDTACSSSLVAFHVACQSLRRGETELAIVGGVNLMCSPETTIALSKAHMLAPDGRCKTFDASADGFSRGEGCVVLVLKRLSTALAAGDRVFAVVRGTAANQDGKSGGLTVPNGPAQEAVVRAALADGGVEAKDVDYVEAHGTGTSLGDPIEVRALGGVFGPERPRETPLVIGSVKTNFGHLESAAGIAGILKVVLALVHERIPKHLHFTNPSPHIDWASYPVEVAATARPWRRGARRRLAGVSSFGFSGTNAHVIIEEAPQSEPPAPASAGVERPVQCLALSAQDPAALRALAAEADRALASGVPLADAAHTAGAGRSHFTERLSVVASDSAEARAALAAFAGGTEHPSLARGTAPKGGPLEVVFLFTGQGSQYPGMAQALYESAPVFRDVIDRCSEILGADGQGRTLRSVLAPGPAEGAPIHDTVWTQPALFALEYGLTELWRSFGVEPAAVIGHSVGEYVAACVAGVYSLEQGLSLIQERGRLLQALPPGGTMAALFAPVDDVARAVAPVADRVAIAAVNGPESVVISGAAEAVEAIVRDFEARNVQGHRLFVSFAAHSPLVAPAMAAMQAAAAKVTMSAPKLPIAWNVTGGAALPGGAPDPAYFAHHLREPVRFADGLASLASYGAFLEVGPHPVLVALAERCFSDSDSKLLLGSLRRGKDDWRELMTSLGKLYACGAKLDFAGVDRAYARKRVAWPTYPFQRQHFWVEPVDPRAAARPTRSTGSLSGERLPTAVPLFETTLSPHTPAYLGEHRLLGSALVAGPVFLEMAQSAARAELGAAPRAVADFAIREPLVLPDAGKTLQTQLTSHPDGSLAFAILSAPASPRGEWLRHAEGRLVVASGPQAAPASLAELEARLGPSKPCDPFYARLVELGIELGEAFRPLASARILEREALARLQLPGNCKNSATWAHPSLLDGCLQAVGLTVPAPAEPGDVYLFSGVERIDLARPLPDEFFAYARTRAVGDKAAEFRGDVTLLALDGSVLGELTGVSLRRASREVLARVAGAGESAGLYYRVDFRPAPLVLAAAPWLVEPQRFAARLKQRFDALAEQHQLAAYDDIMPALDRQSAYYVASALQKLGFSAQLGRSFAVAEEATRLGVLPRYSRLFARLLEMLAEDGVLRPNASGYEVARGLESLPPPELAPARFGTNDAELSMLRRAGPELARVLRGEQDPLQLLFPGGAFAEARKLYVESPYARTYNHAIGEALQAAIAALPEGASLRVLEIGAGTGGTTTYTLPLLPPGRTRYTFTDLSPLFLQRAAETFANFDFVDYRLLDIESDPLAQGFEARGYDLVIAANVLHATLDLGRAVDHAKKLLAPSGMLLLLEGVSAERWVDLTFGLTDGWWRFTDTELRASYPLIHRERWTRLLEDRGFTGVTLAPEGTWVARRGAQQAVVVARAPELSQRWTVIGGPEAFADSVCRKLRERGDIPTRLPAEPVTSLPEADVNLYLGALELAAATTDLPRRSEDLACAFPLAWLAEAMRSEQSGRTWLVTRGAQAVAGSRSEAPEWQAPLWGVGRGFALEQPSRFGGLVDLPPEGNGEELAARLLELVDPYRRVEDHEEQVALRDGIRYSARLVEAPAPPAKSPRFADNATYLVSGGFGGLGLLVGRYLAERGARHIALLGRRPDPGAEGVRAIEALGARVIPIAADLGEPSALDAIQRALAAASAPELRGIFHAAADLSAAPIGALDDAAVRRMLRPKLHGTLLLERLSRGKRLDFFVLFSSTTALLGASGLAHYAAANAFLDAFALSHRSERVLSVNFGTWEAMRLATASEQATFRSGGLLPMSSSSALDALGRLLSGPEPQAVVARIDWSVLKPLYEARKPRRFLAEVGVAKPELARAPSAEVATETLAARVAGLPPEPRREMITDFVVHEVATVLGADRNLPLDKGLFELGMDSLMSVELKKRLERGVGRPLPSTLTFNYPNVNALAAFLDSELGGAPNAVPRAKPAAAASPPAPVPTGDLDKLSTDDLAARLRARLERAR